MYTDIFGNTQAKFSTNAAASFIFCRRCYSKCASATGHWMKVVLCCWFTHTHTRTRLRLSPVPLPSSSGTRSASAAGHRMHTRMRAASKCERELGSRPCNTRPFSKKHDWRSNSHSRRPDGRAHTQLHPAGIVVHMSCNLPMAWSSICPNLDGILPQTWNATCACCCGCGCCCCAAAAHPPRCPRARARELARRSHQPASPAACPASGPWSIPHTPL